MPGNGELLWLKNKTHILLLKNKSVSDSNTQNSSGCNYCLKLQPVGVDVFAKRFERQNPVFGHVEIPIPKQIEDMYREIAV